MGGERRFERRPFLPAAVGAPKRSDASVLRMWCSRCERNAEVREADHACATCGQVVLEREIRPAPPPGKSRP